jgi:adenylate cyclase
VASDGQAEPVDRQLFSKPPSLTAGDIAAEIGREERDVRRMWRTLGFPDPEQRVTFYASDIEVFRVSLDAQELIGWEIIEHHTRAVGASTRNLMEASLNLLPERFGAMTEVKPAEADQIWDVMTDLMTRQIRAMPALLMHQARETFWFMSTGSGFGAMERNLTVAFCDLVGSTQMANESPRATGHAITEFETFSADEIAQRGGRLVKFVGDEVMFATNDVDDAHHVALALLEWVSTHDHLSSARAGIASGPVIVRNGDLYGATVNLAARLASLAEPDTIVVADDTADTTVTVRGFREPVRIRTTFRADRG